MGFTEVNEHTKKTISDKKYKNMGKFSVTTPDRSTMAFEKTFSLEEGRSVLSSKDKNNAEDKTFLDKINNAKKTGLQSEINKTTSKENKKSLSIPENEEKTEIVNVPAISNEAMQLINALMHTQNSIVQELTDAFDRRFEKFDDIVMDLIRCKTENERLKNKVDNLTRDNYKLKKNVERYKKVIPGVYIKKASDQTGF